MSEHSKPTQNQRVLDYMAETGGITQLEALNELGVMRLASRISDLRKRGYNIFAVGWLCIFTLKLFGLIDLTWWIVAPGALLSAIELIMFRK